MKYNLVKEVIDLLDQFEKENINKTSDINDFKNWIVQNQAIDNIVNEPNWEGKSEGRSPESVINTLIIHMNRYAKSYSKSAILGSDFSSQEDFIYLINLKVFGEMSKMDLIKKNVHEKPTGIQIINRLISQEWIDQTESIRDKRSKVLKINENGIRALELQMHKIRQATKIVTGDLTYAEKMELIRILNKLNQFHLHIYEQNIEPKNLLNEVLKVAK